MYSIGIYHHFKVSYTLSLSVSIFIIFDDEYKNKINFFLWANLFEIAQKITKINYSIMVIRIFEIFYFIFSKDEVSSTKGNTITFSVLDL